MTIPGIACWLQLLLVASVWPPEVRPRPFIDVGSRCPTSGVCMFKDYCPSVNRSSFMRCRIEGKREFLCCPEIKPRKSDQVCDDYKKTKHKPEYAVLGNRILEGDSVNEGVYTHMAAVGYPVGEKIDWSCGGTLISDLYVLTAAHCNRNSVNSKPVVVRLGQIDLENGSETGMDYKIQSFKVHTNYKSKQLYNDIGLIQLSRSVKFTGHIFPACLYTKPFEPKELVATGWGVTTPDGVRGLSELLLQATLTHVPLARCKLVHGSDDQVFPRGLVDSMLCAIDPEGRQDTCKGDSGGPVQILEDKKHSVYSVVGVTSFGTNPCGGKKPSVYARVFSYLDWIEGIVWK